MHTATTSPRTVSALPALVFTAFVGTMAMMAFVAVVGPVSRQLGLAEWHAGLAVTAGGLLWMLSARAWGRLSDRIGRRRVLLAGLFGYALVYALMAVFVDTALGAPPAVLWSVVALVGTRALIGLFYAAVPPTAAALVADEVAPGARGAAMARLGTANAIGMVLGPAAAGWIASYGLAATLYVAALSPLLSMAVLCWRLPASASAARGPGRAKATMSLLDRRLRLPLLTVIVAMVSVTTAQVAVGFFVLDRLHLSPTDGARAAGMALTAVGVGLMCAQTLLARLRRLPPARCIALGALIAGIGFASVVLVSAHWQLMVAYGLAAFGMGFVLPSFQALAADSVEAHEQGAAAGTVASMQGLGMVAGPLLATVLYRGSPSAPYLFVGAVLVALAFVAVLHIRKSP